MSMSRRDFLRGVAASTFGLGVGASSTSAWALQSGWGTYPVASKGVELPVKMQAKRILDIHFEGGFSPWESFYTVPSASYGKNNKAMWWTFLNDPKGTAYWHDKCWGSGVPLHEPWLVDGAGTTVHLGPHIVPLRQRKDVLKRTRVLTMAHKLGVHELAVPLALTGQEFGSPRKAAMGAIIQRHFHEKLGPSAVPYAYVVAEQARGSSIASAWSVGLHEASHRPLQVYIGMGQEFPALLARQGLGGTEKLHDALLKHYVGQYRQSLTPPGAKVAVRSPDFEGHATAATQLGNSAGIAKILKSSMFSAKSGNSCDFIKSKSLTRMQLELAVSILQQPGGVARYVQVVDRGYSPHPFGWDTHTDHARGSAITSHQFWSSLMPLINKPGEKNPAKIDLDDTLICISTEFGRSPLQQVGKGGRNHWPNGYVTAVMGGPVQSAQAGLVGHIDSSGIAVKPISPLHQRAALLVAMGIWPFELESFDVGGVPGGSATKSAQWLREHVLGVPV